MVQLSFNFIYTRFSFIETVSKELHFCITGVRNSIATTANSSLLATISIEKECW